MVRIHTDMMGAADPEKKNAKKLRYENCMRNGKDQGEPFLACLLDFAPQISYSIRVSMKILVSFIYETCLINSYDTLQTVLVKTFHLKGFVILLGGFVLAKAQ
jgi:hypothetical protein